MNRPFAASLGILFAITASPAPAAPEPQPKAEDRELHVVCAGYVARRNDDGTQPGPVTVRVDRPGKAVTLVLCANSAVGWDVALTPQTRLTKVVLGGGSKQTVQNVPEQVEVIQATQEAALEAIRQHRVPGVRPPTVNATDRIDSPLFRSMVRQIHELTGQEIASFQAVAQANPARPVAVDRVQSDPRLRSDYPRPTPAADLPKLTFRALEYTPDRLIRVQAAIRDFTLTGPTNAAPQPLPADVLQVVVDPATKKMYGLTRKELVEVDPANNRTTPLAPGPDRPHGIAFDTKRNRLLVAGKRLYAYDVAGARWSVLGEIERLDPLALAYHPGEDALFALGTSREPGRRDECVLARVDDKGAAVETVRLGEPMFPSVIDRTAGLLGGPPVQLVFVGDFLVVLATERPRRVSQPALEAYLFVVEPKTGKVRLTWRTPAS